MVSSVAADATTKYGSGFFIDGNGTAVTNYHVLSGASSAKIKTTDGKTYNVLGTYGIDTTNDLAVLKIDGSGFAYLELADSDAIKTGATVYAIGNPKGLESTITQGIVSYTNRVIDGCSYIQTSAPISAGSSGGVLIDVYGKAVGVTAASATNAQNLNLAVPINKVKSLPHSSYSPLSDSSSVVSTYKGTESAYSINKAVPDFGAYFNVPVSKSTKSSNSKTGEVYYYFTYKLSAVTNADASAFPDYAALLTKWGFSFEQKYKDSIMSGNIYVKSNIEVLVSVIKANDGVEYAFIAVDVYPEFTPKAEVGYASSTSVPDFGAYVGAIRTRKDVYGNNNYYYYLQTTVNAASSSAQADYLVLLGKWGFKYYSDYTSKSGKTKGTVYIKGTIKVYVLAGTFSDTGNAYILIQTYDSAGNNTIPEKKVAYSFNISVPDFGAYFGLSVFKDTTINGMRSILYDESSAHARDSLAISDYCDLLKEWGYKYSSTYVPNDPNSTLIGSIYVKDNIRVFVGYYIYNNTNCIIIGIS